MNYRRYLVVAMVLFVGCSGNNKSANNSGDSVTIHKLWRFDTVKVSAREPVPYIPKNLLDFTSADTLKFSYRSKKENHNSTAYPYRIMHDTIYVNHNPAYKILKLTTTELNLLNIFKRMGSTSTLVTDSIIMVYRLK
jgi:hypothetical protein